MRIKLLTVAGLAALAVGGFLLAGPKDKPAPRVPTPPSHVDEIFTDHDKNKDGFLTPDELPPGMRARFHHADANKDGKLSREEVERALLHLLPQRRPSDLMYTLIEMTAHDESAGEELQRAYDILRSADRNKDGKLDAEELKNARGQVIKERIEFLFKELDADGDGRISKAEARGAIRQNFDQIDTNKDGFISREELLKAATEKRPGLPEKK
jgi:Ca2+-binding EF-hand superfamily protein